jgi:serine protease inhibitor
MHGKKRILLVTVLVVLLAAAAALAADRDKNKRLGKIYEGIAEGNNKFTLDLYHQLKTNEGNLFLSPFSIRTALAMTYAGARGRTATQMADVLYFPENQKKLHPDMGRYIQNLNEDGSGRTFKLSVANALWGQKGYPFLSEFLDLIKENYGGRLTRVDFVNDTEGARLRINAWVERKTKEKIKNLIEKGIIKVSTRLVLTNAIYFKGTWEIQFDPSVTAEEAFFISATETVQAPTMHLEDKFRYMENNLLKVIELPYHGDRLVMDILLPKDVDGLPDLEAALTAENLEAWLGALAEQDEIVVALPRFKTDSAFRLDEVLKALGMVDAFGMLADFTGMTAKPELFISAVVHKAFVDVNEAGTEAAAATGVVVDLKSAGTTFYANHPFIFLIRDLKSGAVLFLGRLTDPTE